MSGPRQEPAVAPPPSGAPEAAVGSAWLRLRGLIRKETLQILRDPSSISIAFVLPAILLLLFGYGVSLDAEHVPVAVVIENPTNETASFAASLVNSRYFAVDLSARPACGGAGADRRRRGRDRRPAQRLLAAHLVARRRADPGDRQRRRRQHRPHHRRLHGRHMAELAGAARASTRGSR